jgi:indolepyruvate ferredoxin oxidoreductase
VGANIAAFSWGRRWVVDADRVETQAGISSPGTSNSGGLGRVVVPELPLTIQRSIGALDLDLDLADRIGFLAADLVGYQDASYADSFVTFVASIASAEQASTGRVGDFTRIVADGLHKLMAYKDEYEVARLLIAPEAEAMATTIGGPGAKVSWKLHPPLLRALGMGSKMTIDQRVGRPVMKILARGKRLRGTAADPFGRTALRRLERNLITEYREVMAQLARRLDAGSYPGAVDVARAALDVRGYEEIKMERAAVFRAVLRAAAE